ncbi:unnamed protein product [Sphagnum balticum]
MMNGLCTTLPWSVVNYKYLIDVQVLVRVAYAGVNPVETYIRAGITPMLPPTPYTPGTDMAGTVEKIGAKVTHVKGAAIGVPYFTAYRSLFFKCHSRPGETVLVHGASGAVGIAGVQIAHSIGMTVIGTAGTDDGLALVKQQGADFVFNHREKGYEQKIVVVGSRGSIDFQPVLTIGKEATIVGVVLPVNTPEEWHQSGMFFASGARQGWLNPIVDKSYALTSAGVAQSHHDVIEHAGGSKGKLTIDMAQT